MSTHDNQPSTRAEYLWTVPVRGDGRQPRAERWNRGDWNPGEQRAFRPVFRDERADRFGPFDHVSAVGRAADVAGFDGVVVPYDPAGEESWITAGGLLRESRWLRVGPQFHAGFATPVYAAKVSVTLQRFVSGRLDWHPVVETDDEVQRAQGDFVSGPDRYARADEFLTVAKGVWHEESFTYEGRFHQVVAGGFTGPLAGVPFPRVYLSGESDAALELSGKHADVHLFPLSADPADLARRVTRLAEAADRHGRHVSVGLRVPVLVREDAGEAYEELLAPTARTAVASPEPPHGDGGLWSGFDALGHRDALGLVGSYDAVADLLTDYRNALGVTHFIVSARPAVEEAYRFGEHVLPRLRASEASGERPRRVAPPQSPRRAAEADA
ncbi:LLM class flavin-dependent oxidoreductase [Yinghuangia sp. ASG 101]|uniref:LLM class flavin-dependent oxidoreductase n=1 Tax=Yinghuangia sp. ASG 101 TaxID=2896848 RepID=UPI001E5105D0|nr:LLM class flavin-dependent oxidoreductase [Yinghuangia sp. ASG 101]UGQ12098.1 LLM class flavin-dependent oxidoreductase [Yinghuangia sp. ASG 101]